MFNLFNVLKPDGSMHQEQQIGNLRMDLTTGETSTVIGGAGNLQTVVGPNGQVHLEQQVGNMRIDMGNGGTSQLF